MVKKVLEYITNLWYSIFRIGDCKVGVSSMDSNRFWKLIDKIFSINKKLGVNNSSNNMLNVLDIAKYFSSFETMTHKKLQKLVYYAYAWYIALYNDDADHITNRLCCDTSFEAWVHGPVCRTLYNYCGDNYGCVPKYEGEISALIIDDLKKFLDKIYKTFGKYTGDELESMTHQEMPWKNARDTLSPSQPSTKKISERDMFIYYNNLNDESN